MLFSQFVNTLEIFLEYYRLLELESNPVSAVYTGLMQDGRDLDYLLNSLLLTKLYRAAQFIATNVLYGEGASIKVNSIFIF